MKGIIFNVVQQVVTDAHGEDTWDALLDAAGLDGAYTSLGSYPDEHLFRLVAAAASALGQPPDQILRQLGEGAIPVLAEKYPIFFADHTSTRTFLLTLNDVIHKEVCKLYPDAQVPTFAFDDSDSEVLHIFYHSRRKLCALAEGFIRGTATHFGERAILAQTECMQHGAARCLIECRIARLAGSAGERSAA